MIDQLLREHDRMRSIVDTIERHLAAVAVPTDPTFARARWSLSRELATHLAAERRAYPAIRTAPRGQALYDGLDHALDDDIRRHMAQWTGTRIEREWPAFRSESRLLLRRLRRRMAYEETSLFPAFALAAA